MEKSKNRKLNTVLRFIGDEIINNLEMLGNDISERSFVCFSTMEEIETFFAEYLKEFYNDHSMEDIEKIRYYTGINFNDVNSILRGMWSYEKSGKLTPEREKQMVVLVEDLKNIMLTLKPLKANIKTYRGVTLSAFKDYGIYSIQDLETLKNQYYYESGFTSTLY